MKNKKGTIIVGIVSLLFVGTAIYFVIKGINAKPKPQGSDKGKDGNKDETKSATETPATETPVTETPSTSVKTQETQSEFTFPIRRSQSGDNVKKLQELLLKLDPKSLPKFGADKFFGTETENALIKYIGKNSISSQADIDAIKQKIMGKMAGLYTTNMALSPLGITVKY